MPARHTVKRLNRLPVQCRITDKVLINGLIALQKYQIFVVAV